MNINNQTIEVIKKVYTLPNHEREDVFRVANELTNEDRQHRGFTFWLHEVMYDKFYGYQDGPARRLLF